MTTRKRPHTFERLFVPLDEYDFPATRQRKARNNDIERDQNTCLILIRHKNDLLYSYSSVQIPIEHNIATLNIGIQFFRCEPMNNNHTRGLVTQKEQKVRSFTNPIAT